MTAFFHAIADLFEAMFKILPLVGPFLNIILIICGVVGTYLWLKYMVNRQNEEKGFNS